MSLPVASEAARLSGVGIVSVYTLELFGLSVQPIGWALMGGVIGLMWARPAGKVRSVLTYLAASLGSALLGHALALYMRPDLTGRAADIMTNTFAFLMAVFFHPLLSAAYKRVGPALDRLLSWAGLKEQP